MLLLSRKNEQELQGAAAKILSDLGNEEVDDISLPIEWRNKKSFHEVVQDFSKKITQSNELEPTMLSGKGIGLLPVQQIAVDIDVKESPARELSKRFNKLFRETPTIKSLRGKKMHVSSHGYAENQFTVPFDPGQFGFTVLSFQESRTRQKQMALRLPRDIQLTATPDIKQCLKEVMERARFTPVIGRMEKEKSR